MNVPSEAYGSIESSKLQSIAHNDATHPGLYVTSARKFELNNDFSCPNIKEKWPTSPTVCMFCAITSLAVKFRKSLHIYMAYEDDTSVENTRPFLRFYRG